MADEDQDLALALSLQEKFDQEHKQIIEEKDAEIAKKHDPWEQAKNEWDTVDEKTVVKKPTLGVGAKKN